MPDPAHSLDVAPGKPFALVFHGGSGSAPEEIAQAVSYGVKMNIDTDTQYAFSRAVAGHMFSNYDSVLKIDGEVGNKKMYDPRSWGREAESAMAARVVEACRQPTASAGKALKCVMPHAPCNACGVWRHGGCVALYETKTMELTSFNGRSVHIQQISGRGRRVVFVRPW